uniref:Uncharacterized protein n=1 Tax=Arundo donax TaxID=35708 RepID=A0A0A9DPM9_ARUDO
MEITVLMQSHLHEPSQFPIQCISRMEVNRIRNSSPRTETIHGHTQAAIGGKSTCIGWDTGETKKRSREKG